MQKIIIFDMDGVLFDTIPYAREVFLKRFPNLSAEEYNGLHESNYHENIKKYLPLEVARSKEDIEKTKKEYAEKKSKTPAFPGIKELLEELQEKGAVLTINTNSFICKPLLEKSGISTYFDFVADAHTSKDKVKKFHMIKDRYNAEIENLLFVTDALGDVKDADELNIKTIGVTWGVHNKETLTKENNENLVGVAETAAELKALLS